MYTFSQFIYKSNEYLESNIKEETLKEVEDLSKSNNSSGLRFDGIYVTDKLSGYWQYLRFFADGSVTGIAYLTLNPQEVFDALDNLWYDDTDAIDHGGTGAYAIINDIIEFSLSYVNGKIDYYGTIKDDSLKLHSVSRINGHESIKRFQFIPIIPQDKPAFLSR